MNKFFYKAIKFIILSKKSDFNFSDRDDMDSLDL